jgi:hypothetical protein
MYGSINQPTEGEQTDLLVQHLHALIIFRSGTTPRTTKHGLHSVSISILDAGFALEQHHTDGFMRFLTFDRSIYIYIQTRKNAARYAAATRQERSSTCLSICDQLHFEMLDGGQRDRSKYIEALQILPQKSMILRL